MFVTRRGDVGGPLAVNREIDRRDERPLRQQIGRRRDLGPAIPAILRDMHQAIVSADPEHALLMGRLGEGKDRAVGLRAGVVPGDWTARRLQLLRIVAGQVRTDDVKTGGVVPRPEEMVPADIERLLIVRRQVDRVGPLEAIFPFDCAFTH